MVWRALRILSNIFRGQHNRQTAMGNFRENSEEQIIICSINEVNRECFRMNKTREIQGENDSCSTSKRGANTYLINILYRCIHIIFFIPAKALLKVSWCNITLYEVFTNQERILSLIFKWIYTAVYVRVYETKDDKISKVICFRYIVVPIHIWARHIRQLISVKIFYGCMKAFFPNWKIDYIVRTISTYLIHKKYNNTNDIYIADTQVYYILLNLWHNSKGIAQGTLSFIIFACRRNFYTILYLKKKLKKKKNK